MDKNNWITDQHTIIVPWQNSIFSQQNITVDILRLDLLHPVVSGNKWLKLKGFIQQMENENLSGIFTQGGPWSNHIVAVAAACHYSGYRSAAILRGKKNMTATLKEAESYGMELIWVAWEDYNNADFYQQLAKEKHAYFVPMGGADTFGRNGFYELAKRETLQQYQHIVSAVGSGTMFSGLLSGKNDSQKLTGISALRLHASTLATITRLSSPTLLASANITDRFMGNGYAKHDDALLTWMNDFYKQTNIPTDIVYTGKTFKAVETLALENYFSKGEKILLIHSGGLQGNKSLAEGLLCF